MRRINRVKQARTKVDIIFVRWPGALFKVPVKYRVQTVRTGRKRYEQDTKKENKKSPIKNRLHLSGGCFLGGGNRVHRGFIQ